jgi:elongation factor Ts
MGAPITAEMVKELRERTGVGMMDCKRALAEADGDMDQATKILRTQGLAAAQERVERAATEGVVEAYIHAGAKLGVVVEVNCETDFVAKTDEFTQLAHDLAMQVAAAAPRYVTRDEIPADVLEREKEILRAQAANLGKPPQVVEKIVDGRLEKFFSEVCLMDQAFIRDPDVKVADLVRDAIAKIGENIVVRRFARFDLGREAVLAQRAEK